MIRMLLLVVVIALSVCEDAEARWFRRGRSYSSSGPNFSGTDQERCYAEAAYMSQHRIFGHVGSTIGNYEGWGYGGPNCATCTPRSGMTLTGDACVGGFRVRSWR